jgi:hypothetical protein
MPAQSQISSQTSFACAEISTDLCSATRADDSGTRHHPSDGPAHAGEWMISNRLTPTALSLTASLSTGLLTSEVTASPSRHAGRAAQFHSSFDLRITKAAFPRSQCMTRGRLRPSSTSTAAGGTGSPPSPSTMRAPAPERLTPGRGRRGRRHQASSLRARCSRRSGTPGRVPRAESLLPERLEFRRGPAQHLATEQVTEDQGQGHSATGHHFVDALVRFQPPGDRLTV